MKTIRPQGFWSIAISNCGIGIKKRFKLITEHLLLTKTFALESGGTGLEFSLSTAYSGRAEATIRLMYFLLPAEAAVVKRRKNEAMLESKKIKGVAVSVVANLNGNEARDIKTKIICRYKFNCFFHRINRCQCEMIQRHGFPPRPGVQIQRISVTFFSPRLLFGAFQPVWGSAMSLDGSR